MDMELIFEVRVFFLSGLCGIACGVLYDLIRIVRRAFKTGAAVTFLLDILFWALCVFLTFSMLFYANYGRIRWYEGFGLALGAAAYFVSASPLVVDGGVLFFQTLLKALKWVLKTLLFPIFFLIRLFKPKIQKIKGGFSKKITKNRLTMGRFWFRIKKRLNFYSRFLKK